MNIQLTDINNDLSGFQKIVQLDNKTDKCFIDDINIDMKRVKWFDADMCAPLGAILYRLSENINTVRIINIPDGVKDVLSKNGFLSHYGEMMVKDNWSTTISYKRFDTKDERFFADYIENELIQRSEIPSMSQGLLKKFRESIFEVFSNAVLHSQTELGIFSCGQFFPNRHTINFTVADLGVGICKNVRDNTGQNYSAIDAILWATEENNTTKRSCIPGGLGLKLLSEFVDLNKGSIQIVSDKGYWQRKNNDTNTEPLDFSFPGTVVTLEINTADTNSYMLTSESDADIKEIF